MTIPLSLGAAAVLLTAAFNDLASRRIPNGLVAALALLGLARIATGLVAGEIGGISASLDVGAFAGIFLLGLLAFQRNLVGGGDVKLLAAATLFLGAGALAPFLLATSLAGGALAAVFLLRHRLAGKTAPPPSLPYGVAIAAGALFAAAATT
jgi:prepilin peptidase CpaA